MTWQRFSAKRTATSFMEFSTMAAQTSPKTPSRASKDAVKKPASKASKSQDKKKDKAPVRNKPK
jgi:hypothetical protein